MGEKDLKVTDKRMFTAEGELREEYRHLDSEAEAMTEPEPPAGAAAAESAAVTEPKAAPTAVEPPPEPPSGAAAEAPTAAPLSPPPGAAEPAGEGPALEIPGTPESLGAPGFLDLVTLLAEPIALYLGDATLPDGESAENLDMARLHIDLLDVLRRKTAGNLEVGESRLLEDLLYRCRLRYVQKRG